MKATLCRLMAAVALSALAVGCATSPGNVSPQASVFAAKSAYAVALTAAVAYKRLPACGEPKVLPCSDASVVAYLQKADTATATALDTAELAVRSGVLDAASRDRAVAAAQAAAKSFTTVTSQITVTGVKK